MNWNGDWMKSAQSKQKMKPKKKFRRIKSLYDNPNQKENCENLKEKYNIRESTVLLERVEREIIERYKKSDREMLKETNKNFNVVEYPCLKINIPKSENGKYTVQDLRKLIRSKYPIVLLERVDIQRKLQHYKQLAEKKRMENRRKTENDNNLKTKPKDGSNKPPLSGERSVNDVLSSVPGLRDLELIRPNPVNQIVQVVQLSGARSGANVPPQNTQTSTQVEYLH